MTPLKQYAELLAGEKEKAQNPAVTPLPESDFAKARVAFLKGVRESLDGDWSFDGKDYCVTVKKTDGLKSDLKIKICPEGDKSIIISDELPPDSSAVPEHMLRFKNGSLVEKRGRHCFIPPDASREYMNEFLRDLNGAVEEKIQKFRERFRSQMNV
jgi:hypothetical protein